MKRSLFLLIAGVLSASLICAEARSQADAGKPNIVLILADDMGSGEAAHNGGLVPTPALDRLAREGMRFTDAHTSSSVCTPTRYGILTGRYNWRSRLKRGVLVNVNSKALMDPKRVNLPRFMQQQGYHTGMVGKWHLGADWQRAPANASYKTLGGYGANAVDYAKPFRNGPVDIGFDEAFFILSSLDMPPYLYLRNDKSLSIPDAMMGWQHNEYNKYRRKGAGHSSFDAHTCLADFARESRAYIAAQAKDASKPFFLYLALSAPHTPVTPGKKFKGRYPQYSMYADFIAETDWVVGEVLRQLEESGVDENTMVVYTSDNGFAPYVRIPKMLEAGYKPSAQYRDAKASIYEGGHRVPFLVRWPGRVGAGAVSDVTICTTDFFATFADVLGAKDNIPAEAAEDSFSFYPSLMGEKKETRPYTVHHSIKGTFAIRRGKWKLILGSGNGGSFGWGKTRTSAKLVQLYDMEEDEGETTNLETRHPDVIKELVDLLATSFREGRSTPGPRQKNDGWPMRDRKMFDAFPQLKETAGN
jgi:arylsulfatase A-like enzyme